MTGFSGFYRFLGLHSLLIGLFPFFIPVFLWNSGYSLASVSGFIAISGVSFCCCIRLWEYGAKKLTLSGLMSLSLLLELVLIAINLGYNQDYHPGTAFIVLFAIANGVYNCFFWTTQRTLFLDLITTQDSGRQYGNFQIFVMVFLKSGIFIGGFLLQNHGYLQVFSVSALVVLSGLIYLQINKTSERLAPHAPITFKQLARFSDQQRSKLIFLADGLFLFLESHFWTISLFLLAKQNYAQLGIVVIVLAITFALLFYVAKNAIDRLMGTRVYQAAVIMYAMAWWLRPSATDQISTQWLLVLLLSITFFTSFFRLAFNKRFYDIAKQSTAREYLLVKSYYTQCAVTIIFGLIATYATLAGDDIQTLKLVYYTAGFLALSYLAYKPISR